MKKIFFLISVFFGLTLLSMNAAAGGGKDNKHYKKSKHKSHQCFKGRDCKDKFKKDKQPKAVPEIDAASAAIALALMAGVISIGRERRRKRK